MTGGDHNRKRNKQEKKKEKKHNSSTDVFGTEKRTNTVYTSKHSTIKRKTRNGREEEKQ